MPSHVRGTLPHRQDGHHDQDGTEIKALLPFLLNLTKDERIQLPKLGSASLAFDEQCASYMATAPNLIPPFVDPAEVTKDRNLRLVLADVLREAHKLCEALDDTLMLVGSEIWMADLSFYQTVRQAARRASWVPTPSMTTSKSASPASPAILKKRNRLRRRPDSRSGHPDFRRQLTRPESS
jgi:hypothetical protein